MKNPMQKLLLFSCFVFLFGNISFSQNIFKEKYIEKEWSKRKRQNEISGSQAIQILTREFSHIKGNRSSFSYSINDWDNTSKKFVKSHLEDLPILNTMKLFLLKTGKIMVFSMHLLLLYRNILLLNIV